MLLDFQSKGFAHLLRFFNQDIQGNLTFKAQQGIPSFKLILVESGKFMLGGEVEKEISSFYIAQFQTTQLLYRAVAKNKKGSIKIEDANPSSFEGKNNPVEYVSWLDAVAFCKKLNEIVKLPEICDLDYDLLSSNGEKTQKITDVLGFRLPTEAEWEFAANGGIKNSQTKFSGSNQIDEVAWHYENASGEPKPVGLKLPNVLGIFDMSGSVWEWCWDKHIGFENINKISEFKNPINLGKGFYRVYRGGAWNADEANCRIVFRDYATPFYQADNVGFRLVFSLF